MMLDTPSLSHQPPTPPGSPVPTPSSPPSGTSASPSSSVSASSLVSASAVAACGEGAVSAELAQQANEVCQLVAKANRAPRGLHADELRRLLSDIHSLHTLAQQLSPSSPLPASSPPRGRPTAGCGTTALASCGIAKKKPTHHSSVLSRPLSSSISTTTTTTATSSPSSPLLSSPYTPATQVRGCMPIRPRRAPTVDSTPSPILASSTTAAAATTTTTSSSASREVESGPRACANCGTCSTVQWRCGADGKPSLCNACGLRYRYNLKKKALYEDIASVRAMTQRSPPFLHSPPSAPSSPSPSFFNHTKASRSPPFVGETSSVSMAAARPPRPASLPLTTNTTTIINSSASTTTQAGTSSEGEGRRSNIYSLLN